MRKKKEVTIYRNTRIDNSDVKHIYLLAFSLDFKTGKLQKTIKKYNVIKENVYNYETKRDCESKSIKKRDIDKIRINSIFGYVYTIKNNFDEMFELIKAEKIQSIKSHIYSLNNSVLDYINQTEYNYYLNEST